MGTNSNDGSTNGASDRSRTSDAKRAANKANAKKSTGPRTAEGKARSSRNATKHGAYATRKVAVANGLFAEDPVEVETFLSDISRSFPARNPALARIASQIAWNLLRQRRLGQFEAEMLSAAGRATGDILGLTPEQARDHLIPHMISTYFVASYLGGEVTPGDDMAGSEARWITLDGVKGLAAGGTALIPEDVWLFERACSASTCGRREMSPSTERTSSRTHTTARQFAPASRRPQAGPVAADLARGRRS